MNPEIHDEESPRSKVGAIFLTLAGLATIAGLIAMPWLARAPEGTVPELSQWGRYLGRFHLLVLHLPIGMLTLLLLLEFGKLFRKDKGYSTLVPAFFTAASAVVAAIFGFLLWQSDPERYDPALVSDHLWWGTGFASLAVLAFMVKCWVQVAGQGNGFYFLTLAASGVVMGVASHDGGSMTHGKSYLTDQAPNPVRELYNLVLPDEKKLPLLEEDAEEPVALPLEEQIVYAHLVQPIFEEKCVSCHGEDKMEGKFRMDTYELLLAGGKEGEGIEPGSAEDSNIIFRMELPLDDEERMPPEGKKQLEEHELAIVKWWLDSGGTEDLKVVDAEMPEEIQQAVAMLVPPEVRARQEAEAAAREAAEEARRAELAEVVGALREEFSGALNFESQASSGLTFTAVSMRGDFGDEHLLKLAPVAPELVSLDLSDTGVTDTGLSSLDGADKLRMLRLSNTAVSDAGLESIAGLVGLESLNLYGTSVTPAGIEKLKDLPSLRRLYLWQTGVDAAAAEELRKLMPACEINLGAEG